MNPIFTVITVHYNQLPLLKSTVESVVAQRGFGDIIDYIIVDGLSQDGTSDYLHSLQFNNSIQKIVGRDKGIYDAMNKGILNAKGEYCIFMNAGDHFIEEDTLFKIHDSYPQFEILYGDTQIVYNDYTRVAKASTLNQFWKSLPFVHQSVIIKTSLLKEHLFNLSYRYCADYEQLATFFNDGKSFTYSKKIISTIMAGGASDVNRTKATKEVFEISKNIFKIGFGKKMNFRLRIIFGWFVSRIKKTTSNKSNGRLAKIKYSVSK